MNLPSQIFLKTHLPSSGLHMSIVHASLSSQTVAFFSQVNSVGVAPGTHTLGLHLSEYFLAEAAQISISAIFSHTAAPSTTVHASLVHALPSSQSTSFITHLAAPSTVSQACKHKTSIIYLDSIATNLFDCEFAILCVIQLKNNLAVKKPRAYIIKN